MKMIMTPNPCRDYETIELENDKLELKISAEKLDANSYDTEKHMPYFEISFSGDSWIALFETEDYDTLLTGKNSKKKKLVLRIFEHKPTVDCPPLVSKKTWEKINKDSKKGILYQTSPIEGVK